MSSDTPVISVSRLFGRVKWFNNKSGFGFITQCDEEHKDNDIFVHYTCLLAEPSPYKYLVQGEYVEFELVKSEDEKHEFHAANVSGIRGGLLMCQTHSLNNTMPRPYAPRPHRVYDESRQRGPPTISRSESHVADHVVDGGFTEVKRRTATPRKRVVNSAK